MQRISNEVRYANYSVVCISQNIYEQVNEISIQNRCSFIQESSTYIVLIKKPVFFRNISQKIYFLIFYSEKLRKNLQRMFACYFFITHSAFQLWFSKRYCSCQKFWRSTYLIWVNIRTFCSGFAISSRILKNGLITSKNSTAN